MLDARNSKQNEDKNNYHNITTITMALPLDQLRQVLSQSLSPDVITRQNAERALLTSQTLPGHALTVLRLVSSNDAADLPVQQSAAVHFKNLVKKGWAPDPDDADAKKFLVPYSDRDIIKNNLVELMCTVPPQIQAQCSESISLIASHDFPQKWDNLLPELINRFGNTNWAVVNGVLLTANSLFKRFRYVQRSDALYADILYVLQRIQEPLTQLFTTITSQLDMHANNIQELTARLEALRSINRIFYSLNYQDLPEYFEDHMNEWMEGFAKLLKYTNPILVDEDEEMTPGEYTQVFVHSEEKRNTYTHARISCGERPFTN
jgi:exportin-2 (importin alpha re-exporter)